MIFSTKTKNKSPRVQDRRIIGSEFVSEIEWAFCNEYKEVIHLKSL